VNWVTVLEGALREAAFEFGKTAAVFVLKLAGALLLLFFGWLIAKVLEQVVVKVLKLVKLDMASDKSGITAFFAKGGIKLALSELIGGLIYWLVMLVVFVTAVNALGLTVAAELLDNAIKYIPNVVAAVFILVLGIFLATLVGSVVRTATANAGLAMANGVGKLSQIVIVVFAAVAALNQLQIATQTLNTVLTVVLGSLGLGLAIALGLGCKDIAAKYVNELLQQLQKKS